MIELYLIDRIGYLWTWTQMVICEQSCKMN